jgi:hypothetical protein
MLHNAVVRDRASPLGMARSAWKAADARIRFKTRQRLAENGVVEFCDALRMIPHSQLSAGFVRSASEPPS